MLFRSLKKGKNIIRGAVINGPGMSDFCIRLLDEKGDAIDELERNIYDELQVHMTIHMDPIDYDDGL